MSSSTSDDAIGRLVTFLTEDLKETGEHLRETDRKTHTSIQLFGGLFVLIATLAGGLLQQKVVQFEELAGLPGLMVLVVFAASSLWLLLYSLKSKETKQGYLRRMNFLRRMIHRQLGTANLEVAGYWTEARSSTMAPSSPPPNRIGLDDLYPVALMTIFILAVGLAGALLAWNSDTIFWEIPLLKDVHWLVISSACMALGIAVVIRARRRTERNIRIQIARYGEPEPPVPPAMTGKPDPSGKEGS